MDETTQGQNPLTPSIRWDDATIEREASHMPPPTREDYRWLKCYTRDRCHRDVDVLDQEMRRVGVYHDKTTWSRILRGRYSRNQRDEPLPSPIISEEKFLQAIEALRTNTRAEALRGKVPFVETSAWRRIHALVETKVSRDRINRIGIVVGATGTGKTACLKEVQRRRNHGATWWMEAPAGGSLGEFLNRLARSSGLSVNTNEAKKRDHLLRVIQESKVIIVDNAQALYRGGGRNPFAAFDFIRQVQDETGCCWILSLTPSFRDDVLGILAPYFEQFTGRSGGSRKWVVLPEYPPDDDVLKIAEAFGLQDARRHVRTLAKIAHEPGRIRRLFEDLQDAHRLAGARKEVLSIDHISEVREET